MWHCVSLTLEFVGHMCVVDASVRELAGVSRLGIVKKNRNIYSVFTLVQRYPPHPDSCE